ncbi:MAG: TlyA family RNA methyltransferase [Bryobacteraceae bacterium]|jgi:23S rRNA (cytidine1920-2'-O)/16S rRNA (cytidine1409-2'-O)-methyltransferase
MTRAARQRLDQLLVERGLAESRAKAQALILAGQVLLEGRRADKPGHTAPVEARLEVLAPPKYVGRGGLKLEAALDHFHIDVHGRVCLDVGASTGGFTDCLLQHGARRVYAVDVGAGQLDWKLRGDERVVLREGLNARHLRFEDIGERADLATIDVSFISVTLILPAVVPILKETGEMVILVKPQFEVGRGQVGKGGIVRDAALHERTCARVAEAAGGFGFLTGVIESPIRGAEGNREFLLYARH